MEQGQEQHERPEFPPGSDEDAPSPKDIYVFLAILIGALLVTAWA